MTTPFDALQHVRDNSDPNATHVFYSRNGDWYFCLDSFEPADMTGDIDPGLLEEAADEVYSTTGYPAAFAITER